MEGTQSNMIIEKVGVTKEIVQIVSHIVMATRGWCTENVAQLPWLQPNPVRNFL